MRVINIHGTGALGCACRSWLVHWERGSGFAAGYCAASGCPEMATLGAHVRDASSVLASLLNLTPFIVPLCAKHNQVEGPFDIIDATMRVPADPSQTCEQPMARW